MLKEAHQNCQTGSLQPQSTYPLEIIMALQKLLENGIPEAFADENLSVALGNENVAEDSASKSLGLARLPPTVTVLRAALQHLLIQTLEPLCAGCRRPSDSGRGVSASKVG